jgi:ABC-type Fe3+ transport system substrate-binding protein
MGTPPETELLQGYGLVYYTSHRGVMYNPEVVLPGEVPKKLSDLANPKWKGKLGMRDISATYARLSYYVGADYIQKSLRAIMKNKPITDTPPNLANRFKLGEIAICETESSWLTVLRRSKPTEWQSLEISGVSYFYVTVPKGAKNPSAAKLVALYLSSPDGFKFMLEAGSSGNILYPNNIEYDIAQQDKARGLPVDGVFEKKLWEFMTSNECQELKKKIDAIWKGN